MHNQSTDKTFVIIWKQKKIFTIMHNQLAAKHLLSYIMANGKQKSSSTIMHNQSTNKRFFITHYGQWEVVENLFI